MTRINVIPASLLLDEHLHAAHREGARPVNEVLNGKDCIKDAPSTYKLGKGHVKFARKHLLFTNDQFEQAKAECLVRGIKIQVYSLDLSSIPEKYLNDYRPTKQDYRHNLARLCERWRKRTKPYHFHKQKVDCYKSFKVYLDMVKRELNL